MELLEPIEFATQKSGVFILSKFPATVGRKIMLRYPVSNVPKLMDYINSEEIMLELMSFCAKKLPDRTIRMDNKILIDQHIQSWSDLVTLEYQMLKYNFDFLETGGVSNFWKQLSTRLEGKTTEILIRLLDYWLMKKSRLLKS